MQTPPLGTGAVLSVDWRYSHCHGSEKEIPMSPLYIILAIYLLIGCVLALIFRAQGLIDPEPLEGELTCSATIIVWPLVLFWLYCEWREDDP